MIKFIIGLIAVVFLALAGYMFTQSNKTAEHKVAKKVEIKVTTSHEVKKPKVSQSIVKEHLSAKVEKKDVMDKVVTSHKNVEMSDSTKSSDEIGKDLTLEGIENANVSDEEKERMRDDLAYYNNLHMDEKPSLSDDEILEQIKQDLK